MKAFRSLIEALGWERVFIIAERQGLSALCLDAVQQDADLSARIVSSQVEKQRMLKMYGASLQMER